jgi:hypothetical protein
MIIARKTTQMIIYFILAYIKQDNIINSVRK